MDTSDSLTSFARLESEARGEIGNVSEEEVEHFRELLDELQKELQNVKAERRSIRLERRQLAQKAADSDIQLVLAGDRGDEVKKLKQKLKKEREMHQKKEEEWNEERKTLLGEIRRLSAALERQETSLQEIKPISKPPTDESSIDEGSVHEVIRVQLNLDDKDSSESSDFVVEEAPKAIVKASPKREPRKNDEMDHGYKVDFEPRAQKIKSEEKISAKCRRVIFMDGTRAMKLDDGTLVFTEGNSRRVEYSNGDISIEFQDGAKGYFYASSGTEELTAPDGTVYTKFKNGTKEKQLPNGERLTQSSTGEISSSGIFLL